MTLTLVLVGALAWPRPFAVSPAAVDATAGSDAVRVTSSATRMTLTPTGAQATVGLVFQPGASVDTRAYVPLLTRLSAGGYLVVVVKQPLDLAFTALGAPAGIIADHPESAPGPPAATASAASRPRRTPRTTPTRWADCCSGRRTPSARWPTAPTSP